MPSPSTHSINSNTGTIRHRHKKSRPAPPPPIKKIVEPEKKSPAEIFVGGSNSIKSQWRHQPILLITSCVKYSANVCSNVVYDVYSTFLLSVFGVDYDKRI